MDDDTTSVKSARLFAKVALDFPDDPKVIVAGPMAELAYLRCTLYSKAIRSDGHIHRARIGRWLLGIPDPVGAMDALVEVGLVDICDDGWQIPLEVWRKWNKTSAEIDETSEVRREAALKGNHTKHHVNRGLFMDDCPLCVANGSQDARKMLASSTQTGRKVSPETETETETEIKTTTSNQGGGSHPKQVAREAAEMLLKYELNVSRTGPWLASVTDRLFREYDCSTLTAQEVHDKERPEAVNPYAPRSNIYDQDCEHCAGSGWKTIDFDTNAVAPCTCALVTL